MRRTVGKSEIASPGVETEESAHAVLNAATVVRNHVDRNVDGLLIDGGQHVIGSSPLTIVAGVLGGYRHRRSAPAKVPGKIDSIEIGFGPDLAHFDARSASGGRGLKARTARHLARQDGVGRSVRNVCEFGAAVDAEDTAGHVRAKPRRLAHAKTVVTACAY